MPPTLPHVTTTVQCCHAHTHSPGLHTCPPPCTTPIQGSWLRHTVDASTHTLTARPGSLHPMSVWLLHAWRCTDAGICVATACLTYAMHPTRTPIHAYCGRRTPTPMHSIYTCLGPHPSDPHVCAFTPTYKAAICMHTGNDSYPMRAAHFAIVLQRPQDNDTCDACCPALCWKFSPCHRPLAQHGIMCWRPPHCQPFMHGACGVHRVHSAVSIAPQHAHHGLAFIVQRVLHVPGALIHTCMHFIVNPCNIAIQ